MFKIFLSSLVMLFLGVNGYAQKTSHTNRLPWVKGEMPPTLSNGYYKVISVEGASISEAQKSASNSLISELASQQGVNISMQTISEIHSELTESGYKETDSNKQITHIKRDNFEANFSKVDEYYEFSNGKYQLWTLFFIANNTKISKSPTMVYKTDNGAWRSLIVPGWGQLYQGKTLKGISFLVGEVALVGAGFYFNSEYSANNTKSLEATNLKIKKEFRDRASENQTYSYIAFGAAAGVYIYNVVDAFVSKSGKVNYDTNRMSVTPLTSMSYDGSLLAGISIQF